MDNLSDNYRKASILMQSAIKKYQKGDIDGAEHDREEANNLYDTAESSIAAFENTMAEGKSFPALYTSFEKATKRLYETDSGRRCIAKVAKLITEDRVLKSQFDIYNALKYPPDIQSDPSVYVMQVETKIVGLDPAKVGKANDKLRKLLKRHGVDTTEEKSKINEAITTMISAPRNLANVTARSEAIHVITEAIRNTVPDNGKPHGTIDDVYNSGVKAINEKYKHELSSTERSMLDRLSTLADCESYFNSAKKGALNALKNQLSECAENDRERLDKIIENIINKEYSANTFIADAAELYEIRQTIEGVTALSEEQTMDDLRRLCETLSTRISESKTDRQSIGSTAKVISEIAYALPADVSFKKLTEDVERLTDRYEASDVAEIVCDRLSYGKYST
ncbi:MAG: hypothetical protein J6Y37_05750 [Paludibacteraceae bacterium]|nr:hypothetical protein [Paludibacteraceae bacterium]